MAVAALLLLTGCEAALDVRLDLDGDGGGRLAVSLAADAELLQRARAAGADPLVNLATAGRALPAWDVVERPLSQDEGGGRLVRLSTRLRGPEELQARSAELADALSAPEVDLLDGFSVAVDDDTIRVQGRAGLVPTEVTTEVGLQPQDAVRLLEELDPFTYTVRVAFPDAVLESNADIAPPQGQPGEVVWRIPPGESVQLSAVGARPGPSPLLLTAGAALAGLMLLGGVLLLQRRRS